MLQDLNQEGKACVLGCERLGDTTSINTRSIDVKSLHYETDNRACFTGFVVREVLYYVFFKQ